MIIILNGILIAKFLNITGKILTSNKTIIYYYCKFDKYNGSKVGYINNQNEDQVVIFEVEGVGQENTELEGIRKILNSLNSNLSVEIFMYKGKLFKSVIGRKEKNNKELKKLINQQGVQIYWFRSDEDNSLIEKIKNEIEMAD